ncbi:MAG: hypothetical protein AAF806_07710 [Bacteroidota bacterium]
MENPIDEAMLSFAELIEQLSDIDGQVAGIEGDEAITMEIEKVKMELPFQLDIAVDENGKVTLGGTPPLYYLETSFTPIFHQISLNLEQDQTSVEPSQTK